MTLLADGTARCDRCDTALEGLAVMHGMLTKTIQGDALVQHIWCYRNGCRSVVLTGMLLFPASPTQCSRCGTAVTRTPSTALLAVDIHPALTPDTQRSMTFCHAGGCSAALLTHARGAA